MAYEFRFPDIGEGLTEGEVVEWKVKVGDYVTDHQTILEVETDKAVAEVPSPTTGYIISLKGEPGDIINVGEVIAVIGDKAEAGAVPSVHIEPAPSPEPQPEKSATIPAPVEPAAVKPAAPAAPPPAKIHHGSVGVVGELEEAPDDDDDEPAAQTAAAAGRAGKPRVEALPKDRLLARELGVDIEKLRGTGNRGRVTEDDIRKGMTQQPERGSRGAEGAVGSDDFGPVERTPLRGVRRKIATAMVESISKTAQVTTTDEADAGLLWHIRNKEKAVAAEAGIKLTLLPFIIKAVVAALRRDPVMNGTLDDARQEIIYKGYFNIGIAVETQDGLIVPNIKDADRKSIMEIARELDELADKARKRTLALADIKGGTFTITNYGSIGGMFATPILNYPEVGILGVGRLTDKPVAVDGEIKIKKMLPLSLTFDHRIVDGATAQHFMNGIIRHIEDPDLMLMGV